MEPWKRHTAGRIAPSGVKLQTPRLVNTSPHPRRFRDALLERTVSPHDARSSSSPHPLPPAGQRVKAQIYDLYHDGWRSSATRINKPHV